MNIDIAPLDTDSGEGTDYGSGEWAEWRGGKGGKVGQL